MTPPISPSSIAPIAHEPEVGFSSSPGGDRAPATARVLLRLLGGHVDGAVQVGPHYPGRKAITAEDLERHFRGEIAVAIAAVDDRRSRLLAYDVDERAEARVMLLADELAKRGYARAMIATTGSDADRGKLLIFFHRSQPVRALQSLAGEILALASKRSGWGVIRPGTIDVRPELGEGGLLRIGGRNIGRSGFGPLERFYDPLTGEDAFLSGVEPSQTKLDPAPAPITIAPPQRFVGRWLRDGMTYAGGTRAVNAAVFRLCHEAYRLHGPSGADWLQSVAKRIFDNSPELRKPSPKNRDARPVLDWNRRVGSAWRKVCDLHAHITVSQPHAQHVGCNVRPVPESLTNLMAIFYRLVERRGLHPLVFQVSYREVADFGGYPSAKAAQRLVLEAVAHGLLVIHDRGTRGQNGLKTIYGIPRSSTAEDLRGAYDFGNEHHMVVARRARRVQYDAEKALERVPIELDVARERRSQRQGEPVDAPAIAAEPVGRTERPPDVSELVAVTFVQPGVAKNARDAAAAPAESVRPPEVLLAYAAAKLDLTPPDLVGVPKRGPGPLKPYGLEYVRQRCAELSRGSPRAP